MGPVNVAAAGPTPISIGTSTAVAEALAINRLVVIEKIKCHLKVKIMGKYLQKTKSTPTFLKTLLILIPLSIEANICRVAD